ncbi:MAG: hypothetical protein ISS70_21150 [Phycisphaerae bacterium]|nr:hypothetical protein [Phycisphaerae bacterium]
MRNQSSNTSPLRTSAIRPGWIHSIAKPVGSLPPHSQFNRLRWFAAAERALAEGKHNPCGLFVAIYRQKLWSYITHDQQDTARVKLKRLDFGEDTRLPGQMCGHLPIYDSLAA